MTQLEIALQVFTLNLLLYTLFGQFVMFLTPSIQLAQLMLAGTLGLHVQVALHFYLSNL
jgi:hypothetical protein